MAINLQRGGDRAGIGEENDIAMETSMDEKQHREVELGARGGYPMKGNGVPLKLSVLETIALSKYPNRCRRWN